MTKKLIKGTGMKKILSLIAIGISALLSGCASNQYVVTFDTNPQGATLVCNGKNFGYTPVKLYYDKKNITSSTMNVSNCKATWVSGASQSYPYNLNVYESGGTLITLPRPNVAGYSQDAEFALKVKNMKANEQAASAAQQSSSNTSYQNNNTVQCKRMGEFLNVEIKTFQGMICPLGWLKVY